MSCARAAALRTKPQRSTRCTTRLIEFIVHCVPLCGNLGKASEVKLQRKLHDSPAVLVDDLAEVVERVTAVTRATISEAEPTRRIARIRGVGPIAVRNRDAFQADCIQREEDVASCQRRRSRIDLRRISLVEDVEQSGAELQLLRLTDIEVLEERDVEVAATRSANVERRLRWSGVRERWNRELAQIVCLRAQRSSADLRIAKVDRSDRTQTRARIRAVEGIRTVPAKRLPTGGNVAGEFQANRSTALDGCDT